MTTARNISRVSRCTLLIAISIVGLALPSPAPADLPNDTIGRLFLSPVDRAKIEKTRGQDAAGDITFEDPGHSDTVKPTTTAVALNGLVRRSDGNDIVWVNGKMIGDRLGESSDIKVRRGPDSANNVLLESITVPRPVKLKPGQVWDSATNKAVDCYRCTNTTRSSTDDSSEDAMDDEE